MKSKKTHIVEELTSKDIKRIQAIIRKEVAEVFFDLYVKRSVWKTP